MSRDKEIQDAFALLTKGKSSVFVAMVEAVQEDVSTCTVNDGQLSYTDVQLMAVVNNESQRVVIVPEPGSDVLVGMVNNDLHRLFVIKTSKAKRIAGQIGLSSFEIDDNGYSIARDGENLQLVLSDYLEQFGLLCDELAKVVVAVGVTPNVIEIAKIKAAVLTDIKQRLNNILKS